MNVIDTLERIKIKIENKEPLNQYEHFVFNAMLYGLYNALKERGLV